MRKVVFLVLTLVLLASIVAPAFARPMGDDPTDYAGKIKDWLKKAWARFEWAVAATIGDYFPNHSAGFRRC